MDQARMRPAQVGASTAAAVGAAFLASRLGVFGTIIGVGVISLMSTVGGEMLLRSLERTKQAARTVNSRQRSYATVVSAAPEPADTSADTLDLAATAETTEQPVTSTPAEQTATPDDDRPSQARRWPVIAGGFLASFGLALAVISGIEAFTGQSLDGGSSPMVVTVFRGDGQSTDDAPSVPATPSGESTPTQEDGATSPTAPAGGTMPSPEPTTPDESPSPDETVTPQPNADETAPRDEGDETTPAEDDASPEEQTPPDDEADEATPAP